MDGCPDPGNARRGFVLGIEIKAGTGVSRADMRGLASLVETVGRYKPVTKWLVYGGERRQLLDNSVHALPYLEALDELETL